MLKVKTLIAALILAVIPLAGCGELLEYGYTEYTLPEENDSVREAKLDSIDEQIAQEHEPVSLDSGYLAQYGYNPGNFSSAGSYVSSGEAAARAEYNEALARYSFWSASINDIDMDGLKADFDSTSAALKSQIESIAAAQQLSLSEYAAQYSMSDADLDAFLNEMAEGLYSGKTTQELCDELGEQAQDAFSALRTAIGMDEDSDWDGSGYDSYSLDGSYSSETVAPYSATVLSEDADAEDAASDEGETGITAYSAAQEAAEDANGEDAGSGDPEEE